MTSKGLRGDDDGSVGRCRLAVGEDVAIDNHRVSDCGAVAHVLEKHFRDQARSSGAQRVGLHARGKVLAGFANDGVDRADRASDVADVVHKIELGVSAAAGVQKGRDLIAINSGASKGALGDGNL